MSIAAFDGGWNARLGYNLEISNSLPSTSNLVIDAANETIIFIGRIATSDAASHTIDTTGSSALHWRTNTSTFSNAGTTVKVGLAAVDTTTGPPARAVNVADVITFDVNASFTGGGGGIPANTWQTHVPTTGTKTIAHGDLVAFAVQMTARGGSDLIHVQVQVSLTNTVYFPTVTTFQGAVYAAQAGLPNCIITFSDGAKGFFHCGEVYSTITTQTWNSGSATKEYGQLFKIPAPLRIYGIYGIMDADADCDIVLYSDPLGTPVAERTVAIDLNTVTSANGRRFNVLFSSPYDTTADQLIAAVYKPGASDVSAYYKTLGAATDRISDIWGTDGYGISRASGAFADMGSSLSHVYIGLHVGGLEVGGGGGGISRARGAAGF